MTRQPWLGLPHFHICVKAVGRTALIHLMALPFAGPHTHTHTHTRTGRKLSDRVAPLGAFAVP